MNDDAIRELARDLVDKLTDSYYKSPESFEETVEHVLRVFYDVHVLITRSAVDAAIQIQEETRQIHNDLRESALNLNDRADELDGGRLL